MNPLIEVVFWIVTLYIIIVLLWNIGKRLIGGVKN